MKKYKQKHVVNSNININKTKKLTKSEKIMKKMRKFFFWNEKGQEKETEQMSLTKAVKSVQGDFKDQFIGVEYTSKKGKEMSTTIELPWGRKVRQAIATEKKRAALKAKQQR